MKRREREEEDASCNERFHVSENGNVENCSSKSDVTFGWNIR